MEVRELPPIRRYGRACTPPAWARGGHAQTLWAHFLPAGAPRIGRGLRRRVVELPDGDRLLAFEREGASDVRVLLLHGLSGDVNSDYLRRAAAVLAARGHGLWAVNHRGCGAGRGLAARPYHSGRSEDLAALLEASRNAAPALLHLVIGFSLSGNLALLQAARGPGTPADGILAVNPPVDLERASIDVGRGWNRVYERRFVLRLRREVRQRERDGLLAGPHAIPRSASLVDFDELFTAPQCGFADARDYYRRCSSLPHLASVSTPAVILTAADDPFVDPRAYEGVELPPDVLLHVERSGGHVGYIERSGPGWSRWLDGALAHYVEELATRARAARRPSP